MNFLKSKENQKQILLCVIAITFIVLGTINLNSNVKNEEFAEGMLEVASRNVLEENLGDVELVSSAAIVENESLDSTSDEEKIEDLLQDSRLIRNRRKMNALVKNAQAFIKVQKEYKSFDEYIWSFVDYKQVKHHYTDEKDIPASDDLSTKISKDLKKKGFTFVGPKIIYSYLQAIGIYNDHVIDCDFY